MLSSMLDYSSAMEDALVTKLDKIVFFLFSFFFFVLFFLNSIYLHRHIICYINY